MRRIEITFVAALLTVPSEASAQTLDHATGPKAFRETVLEAARISGSLLVGAQNQGPSEDGVSLGAHVPGAWAGETVCSRVATVDGLYEAANPYRVPDDWSGGSADIPHPTAHTDRLTGQPRDAIGVRVSRGACDVRPEEFAIGRWGEATPEVSLLINSLNADAVFAYVGDGPVRCDPVELHGRSAYDTRCDLSGIAADGRAELQLLRVTDGSAMPPVELVLWFPEG